jgi:hypothetical protein
MGIMFLGGILWKRANRQGALASTVVSFVVYYAINSVLTGRLQLVYRWQPGPFAWAMLAGAVAFIAASLLTRPEDPARMDDFFQRMRRSTDSAKLTKEGVKPLAAEVGQDLILLDVPGWLTRERWRGFWPRYREDLVGFALAWGMVGLLVGLGGWLMQLGQ